MVSANENVELTRPFSPEEVGKAIREMKADSASGPDEGFRSIVNQKISYGCEQESQDLI
jgi:hypothetical protein